MSHVANLLTSLRRSGAGVSAERGISSIDEYINTVAEYVYSGNMYGSTGPGPAFHQTLAGEKVEPIATSFDGFSQAMKTNGIIFAVMLARFSVFSGVRFQFQNIERGRPTDLFGTSDLRILEEPWVGGTTQDLLVRMMMDADLAGNSYWTRTGDELVRLVPNWIQIVMRPRIIRDAAGDQVQVGMRKVGYLYREGGFGSDQGGELAYLDASQVAHFAPIPDPQASFRGMSWLSPVIREVQSDNLMNQYKQKFFENGATPNLAVKIAPETTPKQFKALKKMIDEELTGVDNAYKTLYVGGATDITPIGANLQQIEFKSVQGHGETRIAAAGGVPPIIVGLSEGLQGSSLNAGNFGAARRRFADGTLHTLWGNVSGTLQRIIQLPRGSSTRLWYDARDVPFLREDEKDSAEIQMTQAQTMRALIDAGYLPDSVVKAVEANDFSQLKHSGLYSVQLQPPGVQAPAPTTGGEE